MEPAVGGSHGSKIQGFKQSVLARDSKIQCGKSRRFESDCRLSVGLGFFSSVDNCAIGDGLVYLSRRKGIRKARMK